MKPNIFFALMILFPMLTYAQSAAYERPTVNFLVVKHGDELDASSEKFIRSIRPEEKFYSNKLGEHSINLSSIKRFGKTPTPWQFMLKELNIVEIARKEVSAWYNVRTDTFLNMSTIHARSELNATDENYHIAVSTKRGLDDLKNAGSKLISKTFIILLDFTNVSYSSSIRDNSHTWSTIVNAYIFQLKYDDEIETSIYDCWIYKEDSPEVVTKKKQRFANLPFTMNYIKQVSIRSAVVAQIGRGGMGNTGFESFLGAIQRPLSRAELLDEMYRRGYVSVLNNLEKQIEDFNVSAGVTNVNPIRAKIGRKEGLRTDQQYYVNEYRAKSDGKIYARRKAVVRGGAKIADNRGVTKGESPESEFYQIAGGGIEAGMTLRQKNDVGLGISVGYTAFDFKHGGGRIGVDYLISKFLNTGTRSLYLFFDAEFDNVPYIASNTTTNSIYSFWRVSGGVSKGYYFMQNFCLLPQIGFGVEGTSLGTVPFKTPYLKVGLNLSINLIYPIALVGGIGVNYYFSPTIDEEYAGVYLGSTRRYKDIFPGRSSFNTVTHLGIRINL
ncbi:MAG: hypothetical protein ACRCZB_02165 [Bacteroidales bacterium]